MIRIISTTLAGSGTADIIGDALRSVDEIADASVIILTDPCSPGGPWAETDIVHRWPWRDDFAAACNAALDFANATGCDWAMRVDTDERVRCPDHPALRAFLAALPSRVCVVVAHASDGSHSRERFFRLPSKHRWVGRTHEAFPVDIGEQATVPANIVTWDELPKTAERLRAKNERDVAMLTREIEEHPEDPRWRFYLGGALSGLGRMDEAIEAYREAADRGGDEFGAMACVRAAVLLHDAKRYEETIACCARGMTMRADIAELPWLAAGASHNAGDMHQAKAWARLAMVHGEHGEGADALARRVGFRMPRALREGPAEVLQMARRALGEIAAQLVRDPNPIRITVTSTALNAEASAARCVGSVRDQKTRARLHIYIDAASDDYTYAAAACGNAADDRIDVREAEDRRPLLANLLPIWRSLPDDEVIVWLDGDDWLATDTALATVAEAHAAGALVTYGQFIRDDGRLGFAAPCGRDPRAEPWRASHLKTFRAGLVKRIRDEDLRRVDGEYVDLAIDQAVMLPMLEMAGERAVFVDRILCVYNTAHSFEANALPEQIERERAEVARIRALARYDRVEWPNVSLDT